MTARPGSMVTLSMCEDNGHRSKPIAAGSSRSRSARAGTRWRPPRGRRHSPADDAGVALRHGRGRQSETRPGALASPPVAGCRASRGRPPRESGSSGRYPVSSIRSPPRRRALGAPSCTPRASTRCRLRRAFTSASVITTVSPRLRRRRVRSKSFCWAREPSAGVERTGVVAGCASIRAPIPSSRLATNTTRASPTTTDHAAGAAQLHRRSRYHPTLVSHRKPKAHGYI